MDTIHLTQPITNFSFNRLIKTNTISMNDKIDDYRQNLISRTIHYYKTHHWLIYVNIVLFIVALLILVMLATRANAKTYSEGFSETQHVNYITLF